MWGQVFSELIADASEEDALFASAQLKESTDGGTACLDAEE